ncbi:MAG: hypothetical protein P8J27_04610 [Mariniblastus sp.]|nr:hypothetical protein [Mariniblastus sp.]
MVVTHRWMGLGEMSTQPVTEFLARSLSAFHVFLGVFCLVLSSNVERYLPLISILGIVFIFLGFTFTGICLATGMPWWWTALEGPHELLVGTALLFLTRSFAKNNPPLQKARPFPRESVCDKT